jgi:hypothetical protein
MREVPQPKTLPNQHGAGSRAGQRVRPVDVNLHNPFSVGLWLGLNKQQFGVNEQVRGPGQRD